MAHSSHGAHHHLSHLPVEPVAAIVLAASGVLTSWAGYQASLWDGMQLVHYGRSATYRMESSQMALDASLQRAVEVGLYRGWAEAKFEGEERMAKYYEQRFPLELREAFVAWMATEPLDNPKAPPSPFAMKSYRPQGYVDAAALDAKAEKEFQSAMKAKHTADTYLRGGVILATAMFFAGIGQVFKRPVDRIGLAAMAILAMVVGALQIVTLPALLLTQMSH